MNYNLPLAYSWCFFKTILPAPLSTTVEQFCDESDSPTTTSDGVNFRSVLRNLLLGPKERQRTLNWNYVIWYRFSSILHCSSPTRFLQEDYTLSTGLRVTPDSILPPLRLDMRNN